MSDDIKIEPDDVVVDATLAEKRRASETLAVLVPQPTVKAKGKSLKFILAFTALSLSCFTAAFDVTALPIALPIISKDLNASSVETFWLGIAFLLATVITLPIITILSDIFGRKHVLLGCAVVFAVGSIVMGTSTNITMLIIGRTIQGLGGAGLDVLPEVILTDITTLKERPLYLGLLNLPVAIGTVFGPLIGGTLATITWRWIAWVTLPLLGIVIVFVFSFLTLRPIEQTIHEKFKRIDYTGIPMFTIGFTAFILPITWAGTLFPWRSGASLGPLILGAAILVAFGFYESRPTEPMLPRRLFTNLTGALSLLGSFLSGLALYTVVFNIPIYFEGVIGDSLVQTAIDAFPLCFTVVPFAIIGSVAIAITRRYRWVIWSGWTSAIVGLGLMSMCGVGTSHTNREGFQILTGIGFGCLRPSIILPMQAAFPNDDAGLAMGTMVWIRLIGSVVGLAASSAIFNNVFASRIARIRPLPAAAQPLLDSSMAVEFIPSLKKLNLSPDIRAEILEAYASGVSWIWRLLILICGIGFLSSLFIKELSIESERVGKQAFEEHRTPQVSPDNQV